MEPVSLQSLFGKSVCDPVDVETNKNVLSLIQFTTLDIGFSSWDRLSVTRGPFPSGKAAEWPIPGICQNFWPTWTAKMLEQTRFAPTCPTANSPIHYADR
jgi:hypothetical protein